MSKPQPKPAAGAIGRQAAKQLIVAMPAEAIAAYERANATFGRLIGHSESLTAAANDPTLRGLSPLAVADEFEERLTLAEEVLRHRGRRRRW